MINDEIKELKRLNKLVQKQQNIIESYYRKLVKPLLDKAITQKDFEEIKELLEPMPQIVEKVLIFRELIILEKRINSESI